MTVTVAVTGGIGAGKSTVSGVLAARGAVVVDSDRLAREVVGPGTSGLAAVVDEFGDGVQLPDGSLDRGALASIVFADPAARRRLEAITHPAIRARSAELRSQAPGGAVVVNDIPLLTTPTAAAAFHLVIGVGAPEAIRLARLVGRGMAETDARARIAAQIGDEERRQLCDVWIDNSAGPGEVRKQTDRLWGRLVEYADNLRSGRRAARGGPVLVPYDPTWPVQAARLTARLHHLVGEQHRVDHIGSTAIPGMAAKDVLDLQLTVDSLAQADSLSDVLTEGGLVVFPGMTDDVPHGALEAGSAEANAVLDGWRKRLHVNADPRRSVNLHLRVREAPNWLFALRMRDWLRSDVGAAQEYLTIKRELADRHAGDATVAGYADGKEGFMAAADGRSARWAADHGWTP